MSQHDYNIANQSGAAFRADLNTALQAIAELNSGATEPATTFAYQLWADTANDILKQRNAANTAWISVLTLSTGVVLQRDTTGGVAGLTLFKINFKNALNTFTSFFTNANTAARTYTFQDKDGTIADLSDIAASAQTISVTMAANAATIAALNSFPLEFRSATATSGATTIVNTPSADLVIPDTATLGSTSAVAATYRVIELNDAGTRYFAVSNQSGGLQCDETNLVSTTAITTGADSANVWYSTAAHTNCPYRVVGTFTATEATAGTWATAASAVQSAFGMALPGHSIILSSGAQATTSGTTKDFVIPSWAKLIFVNFNGFSTSGTSNPLIQIGTGSTPTTTGYLGSGVGLASGVTTQNYTTGFGIVSSLAVNVLSGLITISSLGSNIYSASGNVGFSNSAAFVGVAGSVQLAGVVDIVRITTVGGTDTFDAGNVSVTFLG